jgi:predicted nuclease of predicted toxin-antitoxin system
MRFLADEDFNGDIIRGVLRKEPTLDIVRVQDTEIYQSDDRTVLEYAAQEDRILLTHDGKTMPGFVSERILAGKTMPGVIITHQNAPIGQIIEDLLTIIGASEAAEYKNMVTRLPLTPSNP